MASQERHIDCFDCVRLLIEHGAEVDTRNNDGETPLYFAASNGHIEVVQFLIEQHSDVNACDSDGRSCLWTAALNGHTDVMRALVSAGADVNLRCNNGFSPLSAASQEGHINCVKLLIEHGAEVETCDSESRTLLDINIVMIFPGGGSDIEIRDNDGRTTLRSHTAFGRVEFRDALIGRGADVYARNVDNLQAIDIASYSGRVDTVKFLCDRPTCIKSSCMSSDACIDNNCNTADDNCRTLYKVVVGERG